MQRLCFARLFYLQPKYAGLYRRYGRLSVNIVVCWEMHSSNEVRLPACLQWTDHAFPSPPCSSGWSDECTDWGGTGPAIPSLQTAGDDLNQLGTSQQPGEGTDTHSHSNSVAQQSEEPHRVLQGSPLTVLIYNRNFKLWLLYPPLSKKYHDSISSTNSSLVRIPVRVAQSAFTVVWLAASGSLQIRFRSQWVLFLEW